MSENKNKIEKWFDHILESGDKSFKYLFWYILISSVVNVVLIAIFIWSNYEFKVSENFDGTITTILSVLGVFIAFTAINIYSVFNSRVNDEKGALEKLRKRYVEDLEKLEKRFAELKKQENRMKEATERISLTNEISDAVNKDVLVLDRTTAICKLCILIENREDEIEDNNLKDKESELKDGLEALKSKIRSRLIPYYDQMEDVKNPYFSQAYKRLKEKLE